MLIASFADPAAADAHAARHPHGLRRLQPGLLVWSEPALWADVPAPLIGVQGSIVDRRSGCGLATDTVAGLLATDGDRALADWAPAFRIAWIDEATTHVAADHCGLGHWFCWSGPGVAAVSDRATRIGRHFGLGVDALALGGLALTGAMVGLDSAVAGVKKLAAGQVARLAAGQIAFRAMPAPGRFAAPETAIADTMARMLSAYPGAEFELSGGWDSRMMLAGIPRATRSTLPAFTIGTPDDPDVLIARRLAADGAMAHTIVDLAALATLSARDFAELIAEAAVRDDFGANPLDRAGLNLINGGRPPIPRFSGQNGEILRGFYYPGQPLTAPASAALAARIINWRIISNDLVAPAMFDAAWLADTRATITAQLEAQLLERNEVWGDALDRFYLEQRMHRWCGTAISATLGRRAVLLPFFDADVLALGEATPAAAKWGSRLAAREIARLDARLAAIPLASGLVPARVARGGLAGRVSLARQFAGKATKKILQQLARRDAATSRSVAASSLAVRHGMPAKVDADRLSTLGMFAPAALEAFTRGESGTSRSTMGFMFNVDTLLDIMAEPQP